MFNCDGCWDNPCTCGLSYRGMTKQQLIRIRDAVNMVIAEKDKENAAHVSDNSKVESRDA